MENQPQANSIVRPADAGALNDSGEARQAEQTEQQHTPWLKFREILLESFEKARKSQQPMSTRRDLSKDRSKSLFVLVGAALLVLLIFLGVFSSPEKAKKLKTGRRPGMPDLGAGDARSGKCSARVGDADVERRRQWRTNRE